MAKYEYGFPFFEGKLKSLIAVDLNFVLYELISLLELCRLEDVLERAKPWVA